MPVLSHAIIKFEEFMMAWEDLRRRHVVLKAWTDMGLKWAKKYYRQMDDTDAYSHSKNHPNVLPFWKE